MLYSHPDKNGLLVSPSLMEEKSATLAIWLRDRILTINPIDDASELLIKQGSQTISWRWKHLRPIQNTKLKKANLYDRRTDMIFAKNAVALIALGGKVTHAGLKDDDYDLGPGMAPYKGNGSAPWHHFEYNPESIANLMTS